MFIFDSPLGISNNISLNSLMNGGKTRIKIVNIMNEITDITNNKEINLGSFNPFCIWLHKLHTILEMTREHNIKRMKSLKVQIKKRDTEITANLKYNELFKWRFYYLFSEYPNPFDLA